MKKLYVFLLLSLANTSFSQYRNFTEKRMDSLQSVIKNQQEIIAGQQRLLDRLSGDVNHLEGQINTVTGIVDTTFDGVGAQLTATSNFITWVGIILSILAIGIGIYVTYLVNKVRVMRIDSKVLMQSMIKVKGEVEAFQKEINDASGKLFHQMRDEETTQILQRLNNVPDDIVHFGSLLLTRDLNKSHFDLLKTAFVQASDENKPPYLIIFFQHFSDLAFFDQQIAPGLIAELKSCMYLAFQPDIVKSAKDFISGILRRGIQANKEILNDFTKNLSASKYAVYDPVYNVMFTEAGTRSAKFAIFDNVDRVPENKVFMKEYGKHLIQYKNEPLTAAESETIQFIETLN
jgi:hypothetical protein